MKKKLISYLSSCLAVVLGIVLILISVLFEFIVPTSIGKKPSEKDSQSEQSFTSSEADDGYSEDTYTEPEIPESEITESEITESEITESEITESEITESEITESEINSGVVSEDGDDSDDSNNPDGSYYDTSADLGEVYQIEGDVEVVSKVDAMINDDLNTDPTGKVYYVDAVNGNDNNDGLSKNRPFLSLYRVNALELNPGDRVLFKRGCVWNGELVIRDSGTEEHPIVIGMYGSDLNKPMINGCGEVFATVFISDVSHVTVRNLEVTNYRSDVTDYRSCIYIMSRKEKVEGIKVQNNYVHSSTNLYATKKYYSAGFHSFGAIAVCAQNGTSWNQKTINFEDIIIENNRVDRVNGTGICTYSGVRNAQIRNNIVSNVTGDGIILGQCFDSVAEYNIVYTSGFGGIGNPHVNIWTYVATDTVMQYNESYDCQSTVQDGQGYDIDDDCKNVIMQYNYSHDNVGGFFLGCNYYGDPYGNVVRYNISQNDKNTLLWIVCPSSSTVTYDSSKLLYDIYNNTIYTNQTLSNVIYNDVYNISFQDYGKIRNNIFYIEDSYDADWGESDLAFEFSNNCFYGLDTDYITDDNMITENPMLVAAGTGKTGRSTCDGYQLLKNSPCLSAGTVIENNGGLDYWGNIVSDTAAPNIGAYAAGGVTRPENMNLTAGRIPEASFHAVSKLVSQSSYLAPLTDEKISTSLESSHEDESTEQWIEFTFDEPVILKSVLLTAASDSYFFPEEYKIEVQQNGKWVTVANSEGIEKPKGAETVLFNFSAVTTQKMRLTATKLAGSDGEYYMEIAEIAAFSIEKTLKRGIIYEEST